MTTETIEQLYNYSIFGGTMELLILGICLLTSRTPQRAIYRQYRKSRSLLGVGYVVWGLECLFLYVSQFRTEHVSYAIAVNVSCYYLETHLFGLSFTSMLDEKALSTANYVKALSSWAVITLMVVCASLLPKGALQNVLAVLVVAMFFITLVNVVIKIFRTYNTVRDRMDDFSADDLSNFTQWIKKSVYICVSLGVLLGFLPFTPKYFISLIMILGLFAFLYIYVQFNNYALNLENVEEVISSIDKPSYSTSLDKKPVDESKCAEGVKQWIAQKGFLEAGVTINELAATIGTNRSYLSVYINNTYGCRFREWVNRLRVSYAQELMLSDPSLTIEKAASESGYSSPGYFCRVFAQFVGLSPLVWRKEMKEDKQGALGV